MNAHPGPYARTAAVKHLFLDIVGFSRGRSIEAQADIIAALNTIIRAALAAQVLPAENILLLPTGDGLCIALIEVDTPFDVHILLALRILALLHAYNEETTDAQRRFDVRIGIHAHVDNIITDIRGGNNVAGAGINSAQRIMDLADGGQILVSQSVYESIRHRELYMNRFRAYSAMTKHDQLLSVYQFIDPGREGLNSDEPLALRSEEMHEPALTRLTAYYLAHALRNEKILENPSERPSGEFWAINLLWSLARDSQGSADATVAEPYRPRTWGAGRLAIREQLAYYAKQDVWINLQLSQYIISHELKRYVQCFRSDRGGWKYVLVSPNGRSKIRTEWPDIWRDLELDTGMDEDA
jgi:class 3 adenylate cyclase